MSARSPAGRIASMLASGTEIVAVLGLEDRLVAISHECDYPSHVLDRPRASRPRFDPAALDSAGIDRAVRRAVAEHGSVYEIDTTLLARLAPELILTQAVCEVCAVPTAGVEAAVAACGLDARVLSLDAHTVDEILDSIHAVGTAAGEPHRAATLVDAARERIGAVRDAIAGEARPRVLAIEWLDPVFVPAHWVPEMIELAGGDHLLGTAGERSVQTSWDALAGLDPDVLLVMPCGYGLDASRTAADRCADRLTGIAARAVGEGRAFVVDGSSYFNRSGPRVVDGIEILAGLFHPDRYRPPSPEHAQPWRPPRYAAS
jgi:iron complex transport system substrate-binding protein